MLYHELLLQVKRPTVDTPWQLLQAAASYIEESRKHPLKEEIVFHHRGSITRTKKSLARALTCKGFCNFLGVHEGWLRNAKERDDEWSSAIERIEQVIYQQKFEYAAAGLLNANIISRDLGLADKSELSGPNGGPIQTEEMSPREKIRGRLNDLSAKQETHDDE